MLFRCSFSSLRTAHIARRKISAVAVNGVIVNPNEEKFFWSCVEHEGRVERVERGRGDAEKLIIRKYRY